MKTLRLLAAMILASLLSSCVSPDGFVPPITATKLDYVRTGKFSSTTVHVDGLRREGGKVKADRVEIQHNNAWIPNIKITAEGYERTLKPGEESK
ncbi:MAG: hypothetical protein C0518_05500 [Opitutus sp.]|nr:hypothetical protein [Opitutus sp.]